jgi:hypothetical protein
MQFRVVWCRPTFHWNMLPTSSGQSCLPTPKHHVPEHVSLRLYVEDSALRFSDVAFCRWVSSSWCCKGLLCLHHYVKQSTLLALLHPENKGAIILRNIRNYFPIDTTQHPERLESSAIPVWECEISQWVEVIRAVKIPILGFWVMTLCNLVGNGLLVCTTQKHIISQHEPSIYILSCRRDLNWNKGKFVLLLTES